MSWSENNWRDRFGLGTLNEDRLLTGWFSGIWICVMMGYEQKRKVRMRCRRN